jgi:predicted DNA-binding protein (MmcQ/YjbR family)
MTPDELVAYCLAKPGAWQDEPWDGDLVAKVDQKIFAFLGGDDHGSIGLKCGPNADAASPWRERFPDDVHVMPYIGRYGWNTFRVGGGVPMDELVEAVDASYDDVVSRLPKSRRPG